MFQYVRTGVFFVFERMANKDKVALNRADLVASDLNLFNLMMYTAVTTTEFVDELNMVSFTVHESGNHRVLTTLKY